MYRQKRSNNMHQKMPDAAVTGWHFEQSYMLLPALCYTVTPPETVKAPELCIFNDALASQLGLTVNDKNAAAAVFSGNIIPEGVTPIAQAYAGHQFGNFTMLGDGRAHLLGDHLTPDGQRIDIQLKGSGRTPYSRRGDGRAALAPMLREYIISEAMHNLNIPTTRSLCVVTTGEPVFRETALQGAILTRTAQSHLRVGTFEYVAEKRDIRALKELADYAIKRHYPEMQGTATPYVGLLKSVMEQHIALVVNWMRVGFIHGVMNTDNVSIAGETIDYGPCAFMDEYDPNTVFSSIDHQGRYSFSNQAGITAWNMARFAESILPLLDDDIEQAVVIAEEILGSYNTRFQTAWLAMMRRKLGLLEADTQDETVIKDFLKWMQRAGADYTNSFRMLCDDTLSLPQDDDFINWHSRWKMRFSQHQSQEDAYEMMRDANPAIIPRNHLVQAALEAAQHGEIDQTHALLEALSSPYEMVSSEHNIYRHPPTAEERVTETFCGT